MNKFILFALAVVAIGCSCRLKGPAAEAHYGITAEDLYRRTCSAMDPQGSRINMESCVMTQQIVETKRSLAGTDRESRSTMTTKILMPCCISMMQSFDPQTNRLIFMANNYGYWTRDLANNVQEISGEHLEAARFLSREILLNGMEQRQLWSSIVLEESDIEPEKYFRLVLTPIVKGMPDRIYYIDRNTYMQKFTKTQTSTAMGHTTLTSEIKSYKTFGPHILVPDEIVNTYDNDTPTQYVRLLDFQFNTLDAKCMCDFDPFAVNKPSAECPIHSKDLLPSSRKK